MFVFPVVAHSGGVLSRHCFIKLSVEVARLLWLTWLETERPLMAFIWRRPCHLYHSCLTDINRCFTDILLNAELEADHACLRVQAGSRFCFVLFFIYNNLIKGSGLSPFRGNQARLSTRDFHVDILLIVGHRSGDLLLIT